MPAPGWIAAQPYAHRGLHGPGIPENTRAAFEAAIAAGYGIELDVRPSADGIAMVFHDRNLRRLTGVIGRPEEKNATDLQALTVGGTAEHIPTLADALAAIADRTPVLVEVKSERTAPGAIEASVAAVVAEYPGRAAVMSWNVFSMAWFARHHPAMPRGLVVTRLRYAGAFSGHTLPRLASLVPPAAAGSPMFLAHDIRSLPSWRSRRFREAGHPVITWTVRSAADARRSARFADAAIVEAGMDGLPTGPAVPHSEAE